MSIFKNASWAVIAVIALLFLAFAMAGCGGSSTPQTTDSAISTGPGDDTTGSDTTAGTVGPGPSSPSEPVPPPPAPPPPPPASSDEYAAIEAALGAALAAVPGGTIIEIERDTHHGQPVWEVVVRDPDGRGAELDIDMASGAILEQEPEGLSAYERDTVITVDIGTAIAKALSLTPGKLHEAELERLKDGRIVWEIEIILADGHKVETYIDVTTGDVIK